MKYTNDTEYTCNFVVTIYGVFSLVTTTIIHILLHELSKIIVPIP